MNKSKLETTQKLMNKSRLMTARMYDMKELHRLLKNLKLKINIVELEVKIVKDKTLQDVEKAELRAEGGKPATKPAIAAAHKNPYVERSALKSPSIPVTKCLGRTAEMCLSRTASRFPNILVTRCVTRYPGRAVASSQIKLLPGPQTGV